ncbi:xylulose kinase [Microvirga vignae]|uniref:Xylulose kinase n=1 Tax=Microvirga vignae TaxID=1225564 RepID=A0A0H1REW0_9HYPH|nr:xylulokinase [Microvirga vignae]KLK91142.1 xylulose kinase [Microvirga vignae]
MYMGIDLGTSSVKVILIDEAGTLVDEAAVPLTLSRPRPLWSEQDPERWWDATQAAVRHLESRRSLDAVAGIGLSGQMHGAVLLDSNDQVLRPAILWNDGRAGAECRELEQREPASREITGNLAMPGFTAPKLIWVVKNEPDIFARTARVLLPKDWIRLKLTGEAVSDMSDAAGTLWLDVGKRQWSPAMLEATGLSERHMPRLVEGTEVSGVLSVEAAAALGLRPGIPVAGGGGDNAAGAAGIGVVDPGMAFVSLGTSGVIFVADATLKKDPERAVHAFCHCIPGMWHRMAVILSAAATLSFAARLAGAADEASLLTETEAAGLPTQSRLVFLPYLSGERTPHNDPTAAGVIFGLDGTTTRADLGRAALEGVAFALADGLDALQARGGTIGGLSVIGGGARSKLWGRILAAALQRPLTYHRGGEVGPALGAARLAMIAAAGASLDEACPPPPVSHVIEPEAALMESLEPRRALYRRLYSDLKSTFADSVS